MDVRCERCATVYEFDEAQIGPQGVTVKCAQCGHLFKVRRRTTGESQMGSALRQQTPTLVDGSGPPKPPPMPGGSKPLPSLPKTPPPTLPNPTATKTLTPGGNGPTPAAGPLSQPQSPPFSPPPSSTAPGGAPTMPQRSPVAPAGPSAPTAPQGPPPQLPPATAAGAYEFWTVKIASSGEVFRFREMTTLQQWIVERKVGRDDAISRTGDVWRKLGTIPELDPFFNIVDRALQAGGMPKAEPEEPTVTASHPAAGRRTGKASTEASLLGDMGGPSSFGANAPTTDSLPAQRGRRPMSTGVLVGVGLLAVMVVGIGVLFVTKKGGGGNSAALVQQARALYAMDTDDSFRQASAILQRAHAADEPNAPVQAAHAEVKSLWAFYLREDARTLESTPAAAVAATSFRREAQSHLDDAKRFASEALAASPDNPEVNRAMGFVLCVDGSPVQEVDRYLKRAFDKIPGDADLAFVQGLLAQREGRTDEAKQKYSQASQLAASTTGKPLIRAQLALARLAVAAKQTADAQALLKAVLEVNPLHERAKAMVGLLAAAPAPSPTPTPNPTPTPTPNPNPNPANPVAANPANPATPATPANPNAATDATPTSYEKIIALAEKNLEHGRTAEARKLYEKALQIDPRSVEALTGLGYCDLDKERFMSAVDNFRKALEIVPDYGEAIIGMAEAYKVRGDREKAVDYYQRYLKALPGGPKAAMVQANLRELKAGLEKMEKKPAPEEKSAPVEDKKPEDKKPEPKADEPKAEATP